MRVFKCFLAAVIAASVLASAAQARTLRSDDGPAENPPAGYNSTQYVDSKGCVYVRAGYAGQVEWVPRVSRGRQVLCGYKPTFAKAPAQVAAAPKKVVKQVAKPAAQPAPKVAAAPAPKKTIPRRVAAPTPTIATIKTPPKVITPAPVTAKPAAKRRVVAPNARTNNAACPGASNLSSRYINSGKGMAVRCGPQPVSPYESGALTIGPGALVMPKGYRSAWKDDRLNPRRGVGTAEGQRQMEMVWTDTVPRRLVQRPVAAAPAAPVVTMSSKSPTTAPRAAVSGKRYVQVGSFGNAGNARATIAKLQKLGLPVGVSKASIKGKPVQVVMAGPFKASAQLNSALGAIRKAGYRDAFLR